MDAITLRPNFNSATSRYSSPELYANKRARLGGTKFNSLNAMYDKFLLSLKKEEVKPVVVEAKKDPYQEVLEKHGLSVYKSYIKESVATGAKKLRVGGIVTTASNKFSDAVAVDAPQPVVVKTPAPVKEPVAPVVHEEPKQEETFSRTKLHEDTMPVYSEPTPREVADEISNRRLDNYLSGMDPNTNDNQSIDKLAAKISEINAIKEKTSDLQAKQDELLAEEEAMDRELAKAFEDADKDLLSATQSLDKIIESINDTKGRLDEKRRMLERLNKVR